jgi:putative endonuclease
MISNQRKKLYYIYILKSLKDKKFYVGYTEDSKSRFEQHRKGKVLSTMERRPLELIYSEACLDKKDAMHREQYLKTYHGKLFLRNRLKSYLTG